MHTLFALEHNAICDKLLEGHPDWTSDKLFDTARLINNSLACRIHTLEWTVGSLVRAMKEVLGSNGTTAGDPQPSDAPTCYG